MAKATYSHSRVSTFESCKLKYSLQYKKGYYAEDSVQSVITRKGSAFHLFAEHYDPSWSLETIEQKRLEIEKQFTLPEEFSLKTAIQRFICFYNQIFVPVEADQGKLNKEIEFKFELDSNNFTGKLDVLLSKKDGSFYIIDYKTSKNANTTYYVDQMMLYAWALHKQYKIPEEDIINKIQIGIYFALAEPDKEDPLKVFKQIKYTKQTLDEARDRIKESIIQIESNTWQPEANLGRMCEFCPFIGQKNFCSISVLAGSVPTRGIKIKQREWAIAAGIH